LGLALDLLDKPDNPRKGICYRIEIDYSQKRNYPTAFFVPNQGKTQSADYSMALENYLPTLKNQTVFAGVHFKGINSSEKIIPYTDEYKLGGIKSLRGYREEEFSGSTIAWTNMEYRFLLDGDSRFFLFMDYGYFERKVLSDDGVAYRRISGQKLGYGAGLRIDSKAGLLGLDYGLGQNDSFSQGKIHFGIINRF
jgi:outer membrane protein insertion porin family